MKIFYVASYDVSDLISGNGTDHFKMEALQSAGCEILRLSPIVTAKGDILSRGLRKINRRLRPENAVAYRKRKLTEIGRAIEAHPYHRSATAIVSPNHFDISFYDGSLPVFFWTDATYSNMHSFLPAVQGAPDDVKAFEHEIQRRALNKATGCLWASRWAMDSAISTYGADSKRQIVTHFGLNLPRQAPTNIDDILQRRDAPYIQLLIIGFDYKRKGMDLAMEAVVELNKMGVPARLDTIGNHHPVPESAQRFVNVLGPLDKRNPDQLATFRKAQQSAHILVLPTRADAYCMTGIEAMSVGCPPVLSDMGAIPEIVTHNVTGLVLPLSATAHDYASSIKDLVSDKHKYRNMCRASYAAYKANHRWDEIGKLAASFITSSLRTTACVAAIK